MIFISGSNVPVDLSTFTDLEKTIYHMKEESGATYNYPSVNHLRFELATRVRIVAAAKALSESGARFATLKTSRANDKYWTRTDDGGFRLKPGRSSSDAIRDIFKNGSLYGFECAAAVIIILYKAVLDMVGERTFDDFFADLFLRTSNVDMDLGLRTLRTETEMFPGDILYFDNPDYDPNTPQWSGENVIMMDRDAYFGHGIGIKSSKEMIATINRLRKPGAMRSAYLLDQSTYPDFAYLYWMATGTPTLRANRAAAPGGRPVVRFGPRYPAVVIRARPA